MKQKIVNTMVVATMIYSAFAIAVGVMLTKAIQAAQGSDLVGLYTCEGVNPDETPYRCAVEIAAQGDTFALRWRFNKGVEGIGIGIKQGEVLSVIFQLPDGSIGLTSYRITGTTLTGVWTMPGQSTVATETLHKTKAKSLEDVPLEPQQQA